MNKQLKVAEHRKRAELSADGIFDRACLERSTMNDVALQSEVLTLFIDQLAQIEFADWARLDLNFEMHALRGSAAAIGAVQIEAICANWEKFGSKLERQMKLAIAAFCTEVTRH